MAKASTWMPRYLTVPDHKLDLLGPTSVRLSMVSLRGMAYA
ncbi:hypothetical protein SAMN05444169_0784 [Bradyrhizobium erythrophlei]|uniref:Uncharacterized protein n=1 Tax=Bradyrhizobium erythrophlei TaxID=1437360 RepID=A0A1M5HEW9_9BRAD|nr:hypothetical protein SAMN05444169_0784 [Bradyrhizobium erythrophlei]